MNVYMVNGTEQKRDNVAKR